MTWHVTMFSHARDHHTLTASDESFTIDVRGSNRVAMQVMGYLQNSNYIDQRIRALKCALESAEKVNADIRRMNLDIESAASAVRNP